ncbi:sensor histidine kinase [Paenibacillus sp. GCM10012307]|uniref:histidine kinase n=1 Tax=Paenibacillus roseus TaxID=2798579 RepID=A0A934MVF0_9BACL|nr:ATP-binding protein [Paenibacillus roseus]MBJ6362052.1 Spo0B domain-containing protein [Paenibacillus roseus]
MNYILHSFITLFFLTIPQTFIYLMFSFLFWGIKVERLAAKLLGISAVHALYLLVMAAVLPASVHIVHSLLSLALLFFWMFRTLRIQTRLLTQITFCLILIGSDLALFLIDSSLRGLIWVQEANVWDKLLLHWPLFILIAGICWLLHRRSFYPGKKISALLKNKRHRPIFLFCILFFIQGITLTTYFLSRYFTRYDHITKLLFLIGLFSTVFISMMAIWLIIKTREEAINATRSVYFSDVMQMLTSIRGQRHDFLNHIQVISAMVTMKKYEQLKSYIEEVAIDLQSQNRTSSQAPAAAVAALVQSKLTAAKEQNIRFDYAIPERFHTMHVKSIDLIRILGNLMDNAFDEAMTLPHKERYVRLLLRQHNDEVEIEVHNNGRLLGKEDRLMMFTPGYTTKADHHSGLGLSIVTDLVKRYNGSIDVHSELQNGITIRIVLPDQCPVEAEGQEKVI